MIKQKTYFLDLDGCIFKFIPIEEMMASEALETLPGAHEKTKQWYREGHIIVLVTARPYSMDEITRKQLQNAKIFYNLLIMGVGNGERILINDFEEGTTEFKAQAYNIRRNIEGIINIP